MPAKAIIHRDLILRRVANGDRLVDIANDIGLRQPTISDYLASDHGYRQARERGLHQRIKHAKSLARSPDQTIMAHARQCIRWNTLLLRRTLARWEKEAKS